MARATNTNLIFWGYLPKFLWMEHLLQQKFSFKTSAKL